MIRNNLFAALAALLLALTAGPVGHASDAEIYRQLDLFGQVFEKVLTESADESLALMLGAGAIRGMIASAPEQADLAEAQATLNELVASGEVSRYAILDAFGRTFEAMRGGSSDADRATNLVRAAIDGMLYETGPHAGFLNFDDFKPGGGILGGVGVEITLREGDLTVVAPLRGTPAEAVLRPLDVIVEIDGVSTVRVPVDRAGEMLRGEAGSDVSLTIRRVGRSDFRANLVRAAIKTPDVEQDFREGIGYLRISTFGSARDQVLAALAAFRTEDADGLSGLVIDLRNNPGGLLSDVEAVANTFLSGGEIFSVRHRNADNDRRNVADLADATNGLPIVVLINEGTASGAEIVAAALQDNKRAIVVGAKSFGRGSLQQIFPLGQKYAMRLTVGHYHRPAGGRIAGEGVEPDIAVASDPEQDRQLETALSLLENANREAIAAPVDIDRVLSSLKPVQPDAPVVSGQPLASLPDDQTRVALVIGNSAYESTPSLANPANDATAVADALSQLGFTVRRHNDLTKAGMDDAFRSFARDARGADVALFYYAGHAMQFEGVNYLMPVDARLEDEVDVPYELSKVDDVIADMSRSSGVRIAILDSCRDNPLEARLKDRLASTRSAVRTRGLARIARPEGLIVAYATQAGSVAADGDGENSPFTEALLDHIATPGLEIGLMFRRVTRSVREATSGQQHPELSVSFDGEFYFQPG